MVIAALQLHNVPGVVHGVTGDDPAVDAAFQAQPVEGPGKALADGAVPDQSGIAGILDDVALVRQLRVADILHIADQVIVDGIDFLLLALPVQVQGGQHPGNLLIHLPLLGSGGVIVDISQDKCVGPGGHAVLGGAADPHGDLTVPDIPAQIVPFFGRTRMVEEAILYVCLKFSLLMVGPGSDQRGPRILLPVYQAFPQSFNNLLRRTALGALSFEAGDIGGPNIRLGKQVPVLRVDPDFRDRIQRHRLHRLRPICRLCLDHFRLFLGRLLLSRLRFFRLRWQCGLLRFFCFFRCLHIFGGFFRRLGPHVRREHPQAQRQRQQQ